MRGASHRSAPFTPYVTTPPATMLHMPPACDEKERSVRFGCSVCHLLN